jgi:muramoyltetrapeptide carboxypeptidase
MALTDAGFHFKIAPNALKSHHHLAGTDEERAHDLMAAFSDPETQAVYCSRGGYGCARLMPYLDLDAMAASGKMFIGFSDITTLHLALNRRGLVTFHAPMALSFSIERAQWVHESFLNMITGDPSRPPSAPKGQTLVPGLAEGEVTGGCLCLLTDSLGTPDALDTEGKIVLIEDVDEAPHRIDAMLTHLLNAGQLQKAAGLVFGEMTRTDEKVDAGIGGPPWVEIVKDRILPLGIPAIVNYPFGHMSNMLSLALGIRARMDSQAGTLEYLESPCA